MTLHLGPELALSGRQPAPRCFGGATEQPADWPREQAAESRVTNGDRYEVAVAQRLSEVRV